MRNVGFCAVHLRGQNKALDEWCYELLSQIDCLWEDDYGSYGQMVLTPAVNSIRCNQRRRFLTIKTVQTEYAHGNAATATTLRALNVRK